MIEPRVPIPPIVARSAAAVPAAGAGWRRRPADDEPEPGPAAASETPEAEHAPPPPSAAAVATIVSPGEPAVARDAATILRLAAGESWSKVDSLGVGNRQNEGDWSLYVAGGFSVGAALLNANENPADRNAPKLVITDDTTGTATSDFSVTFTFSEPVSDFNIDDIQLSRGVKLLFYEQSPTVYTLLVSLIPQSSGVVSIAVSDGAARDASGNASVSAYAARPFNTIKADSTGPAVTIFDDVSGLASGAVLFTLVFDEDVLGFAEDDLVVSGGSRGIFGGAGNRFVLSVTPTPGQLGEIVVELPAGAVADAAGNPNPAATATQAYDTRVVDTEPPTLAISDDAPPIARDAVWFTFTFSKPVTGFAVDDIAVGSGRVLEFAGEGDRYTLRVAPEENNAGELTVNVAAGAAFDEAGFSNGAAAATRAFDTAPPRLTITDNEDGVASGDLYFTLKFSEPVEDFTGADLSIGRGDLVEFGGGGAEYWAHVSPHPKTRGEVTVNVAAGAARDAAGNASAAAGATQAVDLVPLALTPTVLVIDQSVGQLDGDFSFRIVFNTPVTGFEAGDIEVAQGRVASFAGEGADYSIRVTPDAGERGNLVVSVAAGVAHSDDGIGNAAAEPLSHPFNTQGYVRGQAVIDLGELGQLIHPVQVDGDRWYYAWDLNGDGAFNGDARADGRFGPDGETVGDGVGFLFDRVGEGVLDALFSQDGNGVAGPSGYTDAIVRYATINGVRLALPLVGSAPPGLDVDFFAEGSEIDNQPVTENNPHYDDLLAVWDAHNGDTTAAGTAGVPAGWASGAYWSASTVFGHHLAVSLADGLVEDPAYTYTYVALLVV